MEQVCGAIEEFLALNQAVTSQRRLARDVEAAHPSATSTTSMSMRMTMMVEVMMARRDNDEQQLASSSEHSALEPLDDYDLINGRLLLLLIRYKIFVAQLRPMRTTFGYFFMASFALMVTFPLLARVHAPYLTSADSKWLIILVCIIMVVLPSLGVLPIPWSNARSAKLYRRMASLLAHLVQGERQLPLDDERGPNHLHSERLLWLLRKELNCPEEFRSQFSIRAPGMEITYTEMLKIYFWLGLLIITLTVDLQSAAASEPSHAGGDTVTPITAWLADPLGMTRSFN